MKTYTHDEVVEMLDLFGCFSFQKGCLKATADIYTGEIPFYRVHRQFLANLPNLKEDFEKLEKMLIEKEIIFKCMDIYKSQVGTLDNLASIIIDQGKNNE